MVYGCDKTKIYKYIIMGGISCACLLILILVIVAVARCSSTDGFRSAAQKNTIARSLVSDGEPRYETFKKRGLDGVEYYDAKQLWNKRRYDVKNIVEIL
jgi:hypothetical protein